MVWRERERKECTFYRREKRKTGGSKPFFLRCPHYSLASTMRIRKHAKISNTLLFSSSSNSSPSSSDSLFKSYLICQLNQSPWDIITFPPSDSSPPPLPPPPSYQFDINDSYNGNGSLADSVGPIQSVDSMKLEVKAEETDCKVEEREEKRRRANLCCKTDGKQWQCKREAQKSHTMCNHHLAQIKNYNTLAHPSISKSAASNKPTRARKATNSSAAPHSNPNEFYYYSGFGPRWGKKRDAGTSITHKREREVVEPVKVSVPAVPHYSSSDIDDDEEEEDEENCGNGRKRRRKPIKARSLKDLCEGMG
ncbi:hypothetical protein LguiA_010630 [Lonicera macranthoides]